MINSSDLSNIAYVPPKNYQKYTIKSGTDTLVLREPFAADYLILESNSERLNMHEKAFMLAQRLAITWNNEPGVTPVEIGQLNRSGYKELLDLTTNFVLEIMPKSSEGFIQKYLENAIAKAGKDKE